MKTCCRVKELYNQHLKEEHTSANLEGFQEWGPRNLSRGLLLHLLDEKTQ